MLVTWTLSPKALLSHVEIGNECLSSVFHGQNALTKKQSVRQSINQPIVLFIHIKFNKQKARSKYLNITKQISLVGSINGHDIILFSSTIFCRKRVDEDTVI